MFQGFSIFRLNVSFGLFLSKKKSGFNIGSDKCSFPFIFCHRPNL